MPGYPTKVLLQMELDVETIIGNTQHRFIFVGHNSAGQ